jgi:hypothetical protein
MKISLTLSSFFARKITSIVRNKGFWATNRRTYRHTINTLTGSDSLQRRNTMKLIDADKLKTELDAWARIIQNPDHYMRADALHIIDTAPEIDAVPVVRCKDCQYWEYDHNYDSTIAFGYCRCRDWQTPWSESEIETVGMGYCHHGVKKEE